MRLILLLLVLAGPVRAGATLETLIVERAAVEYGHLIPEGGEMTLAWLGDAPGNVAMLAEFWMDPRTGRFLTNAVPARGPVARVQGLLQITVEVPVPVRRLMPGEVLTATDMEIVPLPVSALNAFAVTDPGALVGREVRRVLIPGRPVMAQSVTEPRAVDRGAKVTIAYQQGAMRLYAPGRALSDAREGEELRVVNLGSNRTVTAIAREDGIVEVLK